MHQEDTGRTSGDTKLHQEDAMQEDAMQEDAMQEDPKTYCVMCMSEGVMFVRMHANVCM